jgi:hypothetical protein
MLIDRVHLHGHNLGGEVGLVGVLNMDTDKLELIAPDSLLLNGLLDVVENKLNAILCAADLTFST